ncbi:hypothetical protein FHX49_000640 [Microbacterium endophyticum]|uniref:Uncharacterized protein n=1 Tax=Microbacterium endophyticum TaxID=1526412 RepID=A0A7W4YM29_9MICO|nr:hypothetical protein [Microbacterium endophyticum]MBB2975099.1 hypothetical protein [Microbacterium endophyticum]NIK37361.1 hypothetical protein [Microbacterium endophyticum]
MTLIYSASEYDTDEIVELRARINTDSSAFEELRRAHRHEERQLLAQYNALLAAERPAYPTAAHLRAFDQIATIVHNDERYGTHSGRPTKEDKSAGIELPPEVHFSSHVGRVNVYALAPYKPESVSRLWGFDEDDIVTFRNELTKRSLRIVNDWVHEDGVAFIVVDGRV